MRFRIIEDTDDYYWQRAWNIYRSNFRDYKRRDIEVQKEAMKNKDFTCLAVIEKKRVIGIVFYWDLENVRYIEHLALDLNLRCTGYEERIISKLCESGIPLIVEIDNLGDGEGAIKLSMYENLGFKLNKYKHRRPFYISSCKDSGSIVLSYPNKLTFEDYLYFDNILVNEIMVYKNI